MAFIMRQYLLIFLAVSVLAGIAPGPAFSLIMTIDAIEDAGQFAGQDAYLKFVDSDGHTLKEITKAGFPTPWTSASQVYADAPGGIWYLQSAGNIWSSDTIVGDTFTAPYAGVYRISPAGGAFTYDSFLWSGVADKWLWELQIYVVEDDINYTLGSKNLYDKGYLALGATLGKHIDITLVEGEKLVFWIADGSLDGPPNERNTIDNSGSLTFNVVLIPEPSTLILAGTGLLLLLRRYRKYISAH